MPVSRVWLGTRDLTFRARLHAVIEAHQGEVTRDEQDVSCAVVEIESVDWEARIGAFAARRVPVLAFGSHRRADLLRRARQLGAEAVANSQVEERLRKVLS